jgi:hypothetical protein
MFTFRYLALLAFLGGVGMSLLAGDLVAKNLIWTSYFSPVMTYDLDTGQVRQLAPDVFSTGSTPDPSHDAVYYSRYRGILKTDATGHDPVTVLETVVPGDFDGTGPYYGEIGAPQGIAVDERSGDVYWAEKLFNPGNEWDMRGIRRLNGSTDHVDIVLDLDGVTPMDLHLDQLNRELFFTTQPTANDDSAPTEGSINRLRFSDNQVDQLYSLPSGRARGISADVDNALLFWIADEYRIKVGSLDGHADEQILATVFDPNDDPHCHLQSLFYYPVDEKLYFGSSCQVGRIETDGTGLEILARGDLVSGLSSLSIFDPQLAVVPEPSTASTLVAALAIVACLSKQHQRA